MRKEAQKGSIPFLSRFLKHLLYSSVVDLMLSKTLPIKECYFYRGVIYINQANKSIVMCYEENKAEEWDRNWESWVRGKALRMNTSMEWLEGASLKKSWEKHVSR